MSVMRKSFSRGLLSLRQSQQKQLVSITFKCEWPVGVTAIACVYVFLQDDASFTSACAAALLS